jgi:hypothetical protein
MVSATTELVRGLFRYIGADHKQRTRIPQQKAALIRQKPTPDIEPLEPIVPEQVEPTVEQEPEPIETEPVTTKKNNKKKKNSNRTSPKTTA